jgi:hypothetical protein
MTKKYWVAVIATVIGAAGTIVLAADLNPSQVGAACGVGETGTWHFVNNQTRGAAAGTLTATFTDAGVVVEGATTVNRNNQHFFVVGPAGPLLGASTDLQGRLVLSDLDCEDKKPPPPPPPK